ncbi:zinc ribbon domain-containing protein [Staphylococcus sp. SQ8-PEA]|uniref:Zinc ribbon domain-containing protein n=1 Tax=Staphylococcus marylandisciuri TaxID=2981529 RepID=A0ABT2QQJ1_9STAP|nr:zinc ribbon domain-containing protein [Staphylococcus marylandisciuri]MCU5746257.1 zinc ribbon domain-containing protein [Staphylococcus marylandisciuri]
MPNYTYNCPNCTEFTIRQSMNDNHDIAKCPQCGAEAKRVFNTIQTTRMDSKLKKRIERGQEPRLVKGKDLPKQQRQPNKNARPWMTGH